MPHPIPVRRPGCVPSTGFVRFLSSLFVLSWLSYLSTAQAGPTSPDDGCLNDSVCRGHYEQAVRLFESGRYEGALGSFQAAYQRRQMPWLLINLGRTLHRLGRPRDALQYYDRFRQAEARPDAETAARLEKYTAQARTLVDTAGSPLPTAVEDDPKGEVGTVQTASPVAQPKATVEPTASATPASTSSPQPVHAEVGTPIYKKWWFWALVGGGALLVVGVGVGAGVAASGSPSLPAGVPVLTFKL